MRHLAIRGGGDPDRLILRAGGIPSAWEGELVPFRITSASSAIVDGREEAHYDLEFDRTVNPLDGEHLQQVMGPDGFPWLVILWRPAR